MSSPTNESVIHDIGFRHYDGPRLGRGWAFRSLLVETLRGAYGLGRPPKVKAMPWILAGIMALVALILVTITVVTNATTPFLPYTQFANSMWIVIAMFVAGRAPYAISRDMRDGVLPLYLSRPLIRRDYVLAKFLGVALAVFLFMAGPLLILVIGSLLAKLPPWHELWMWLGAILMAAVLAMLLTAISLAVASVTKRKGLGVAAIMTYLVMAAGFAGIVSVVLANRASEGVAAYFSPFDPFALVGTLSASWLGAVPWNQNFQPHGVATGFTLTAILIGLIGASIAFLLRRFKKEGGV